MSSIDIDFSPLLGSLSKITDGRVVAHAFDKSEGEFYRRQIPVKSLNEGDKKDTVLRRFIADWVRRQLDDIGVDVRYKPLPPFTSFYDDGGKETRIIGVLEVTWWPKKPLTEMELMMKEQHKSKSWVGRK